MIEINKIGHTIPSVLLSSGVNKTKDHINDYEASPSGYAVKNKKNRTKFDFDKSIYGHDKVKQALKEVQGHKCCFCEAKVDHICHGDIEHFRPKAAYQQDKKTKIQYPGYYWLTYDWTNLYFSCQICNQREKRNYFPLVDNTKRANVNIRDISQEEPLFIDPGFLNPEDHIYFNNEIPSHKSEKGRITIKQLALDRTELNEHRLSSLNKLKAIEEIFILTKDSAYTDEVKQKFFDTLRNCVQQDSEYSNMFKSNFERYLKEL